MDILVLEPYYEPDGGPAAPLFTMLSQELVRCGHRVTVLTAVPHYPSGKVPQAYRGLKTRRHLEDGVEVIRVPLPSVNRTRLWQRLAQFLAYQVGAILAGWHLSFDVFVTITPSLEIWLPFTYFSAVRRKPAIYSVHDVYPDTGIRLGIFSNKAVIKAVTLLERYCVDHAQIVRILSRSFEKGVRKLGAPRSKIRLIYDWVDTELITPLPKNNSFALEQGLNESFVVLYAGNIGFSQGLEHALEAAKLLTDEDIRFVFVGEGAAKDSLAETARSLQLTNVGFLPFQPRDRLPEVLATADVSLVVLRKGMGFNSLPSKTLSTLASGRPMVASIDEHSDTWDLVERSQSGICVPPESPIRLADAIRTLKQSPELRATMGRNGRDYALKHHSTRAAARAFEAIFTEAIERRSTS